MDLQHFHYLNMVSMATFVYTLLQHSCLLFFHQYHVACNYIYMRCQVLQKDINKPLPIFCSNCVVFDNPPPPFIFGPYYITAMSLTGETNGCCLIFMEYHHLYKCIRKDFVFAQCWYRSVHLMSSGCCVVSLQSHTYTLNLTEK